MSFNNNRRDREAQKLLNDLVKVLAYYKYLEEKFKDNQNYLDELQMYDSVKNTLQTTFTNKKQNIPFPENTRILVNVLTNTLQTLEKEIANAEKKKKNTQSNSNSYTSGYESNTESNTELRGGNRKINKSKRNKYQRNKIAKKTRKH